MKVDAKIADSWQATPRVKLITLAFDGADKFPFRAGQWIGAYMDDFLGPNKKPVRRAFSIASRPGENELELCIARGQGFSKHIQDAPIGSVVHIDGPYGSFWLRPAEEYLFIAGGTGIAPLRPMIHQALSESRKVTLIYSVKKSSDVIYEDELHELERNNNFRLVITLTDTSSHFPSGAYPTGRVQEYLGRHAKPTMQAYLCGPTAMVDDVMMTLLKLGIKKEAIFTDKWE